MQLSEEHLVAAERSLPLDERPFDRKTLVRGALLMIGGAALSRVPIAFAAPANGEVAGFIELSRILTGVHKLPVKLASIYLNALDDAPNLRLKPSALVRSAGYARGRGPATRHALERSAAFREHGSHECAEAIAAAWWSGMVPARGGGQTVVTFNDALVWQALSFAEPPSVCLGATGAWAKAGRRA